MGPRLLNFAARRGVWWGRSFIGSHADSVISIDINLWLFHRGRQGHLYPPPIKGVVNCQNSRDKGPPEGNSARG